MNPGNRGFDSCRLITVATICVERVTKSALVLGVEVKMSFKLSVDAVLSSVLGNHVLR